MRRREFIALLGSAAATAELPLQTLAQQPAGVRRIGILHGVPKEASVGVAAFRHRLSQLGYVEGQNSVIEYRWSDQTDDLPSLAAALIEMKVDVIVAGDGSRAMAAKQATQEIPIVVAALTDDPVAPGLVGNLGQPGGNVAGLALFAPEMSSAGATPGPRASSHACRYSVDPALSLEGGSTAPETAPRAVGWVGSQAFSPRKPRMVRNSWAGLYGLVT